MPPRKKSSSSLKIWLYFFCIIGTRSIFSNLTKSNLQYKKQISEAEAESKLGESEIVPLRYQVQRLNGELDAVSAHSSWLAAELKSKTDELAAARAEQAAEMAELRQYLWKSWALLVLLGLIELSLTKSSFRVCSSRTKNATSYPLL